MNTIVRLSLFCLGLILAPHVALAVVIPTVAVGNAGNGGDPQVLPDGTTGHGAVSYNYRIGTTEVTVGQYTAFLNAVAATDTYELYDSQMATSWVIAGIAQSGSSGSYAYSVIGSANKPVTFVSWLDAARFSNWLHNGQPSGGQDSSTTEDGAYRMNGAVTSAELGAVSPRSSGARWFIPSESEWYKAAYHKNDGPTDHYWDYPTSTDAVPYSDQPPGSDALTPSNTANFFANDFLANGYNDGLAATGSINFDFPQNYLTDVGAYAAATSPYGTFDQGGNVGEFTEARFGDTLRQVRGGYWNSEENWLRSSFRRAGGGEESEFVGFRVATVPEPSSLALATMGFLALVALWNRRRLLLRLTAPAQEK